MAYDSIAIYMWAVDRHHCCCLPPENMVLVSGRFLVHIIYFCGCPVILSCHTLQEVSVSCVERLLLLPSKQHFSPKKYASNSIHRSGP